MTAPLDPHALGWHADWLVDHAQDRAAATFLEMHGHGEAERDESGLFLWERRGLEIAGVVSFGMDGLEEPDLIERARHVAVAVFLRRLDQLMRTSPTGGSA